MKKLHKTFYGMLILIFSTGFLYYIGNTVAHIVLDYRERTQERPFGGFGLGGVWAELYGKEYSIGFMAVAIITLFIVGVMIAVSYHEAVSKFTLVLSVSGFLVPIIYMVIWFINIIKETHQAPSPYLWFTIFVLYLIITVVCMIKDMRKTKNK